MPTSKPTMGDIFLECIRNPGLLADLETFDPAGDKNTLKKILAKYLPHTPPDPVLKALTADLQDAAKRNWLHELKTWVIAHPAPSSLSRPAAQGGNTSWQPG